MVIEALAVLSAQRAIGCRCQQRLELLTIRRLLDICAVPGRENGQCTTHVAHSQMNRDRFAIGARFIQFGELRTRFHD
jgi:hypothetical protein